MPPHISDPRDDVMPLTTAFYSIPDEEATLLKSLTGFGSDEALKSHVLEIQDESYNVCGRFSQSILKFAIPMLAE